MKKLKALVTFFKRVFSYFDEQKIAVYTSPVNQKIEVCWVNGVKVLNVGNANYSFGSLNKTFRKTFRAIPLKVHEFSRILILGNAAGGTASILRNEYGFEGRIHGVELDEKITMIARAHFPQGYQATDKVFHQDGLKFVGEAPSGGYDLIIFDIYHDLDVPEHLQTDNFAGEMHRILQNKGMIIYNKVVRSSKTKQEAEALEKTLGSVFADFRKLSFGNFTENRMFVCRK